MDVQVRQIRPEEAEAFEKSVRIPFLDPFVEEPETVAAIQSGVAQLETDRAWVVEARGRFVGNSCIYSMDLALPASPGGVCPVIPMAGVSAVGVHPTHRRRGLLRQMMVLMLADARSRGEAVAGLIASESSIYGRFGFGHATDSAELTIDSRQSAFAVPAPDLDIYLVDKDEAAKLVPPLYERQRRTRAGEPTRSPAVWADHLADRAERRGGGHPAFIAACEDGYVVYRAQEWSILTEKARVVIEELRGLTAEVEAALWRFVLDLDLAGEVNARRRPVDEPMRWRLSDPRQLQVTSVTDRLHVRILDVAAALEARGYLGSGRLVLDVLAPPVDEGGADPAPGRWVLEAGPDGASCRRAGRDEDTDLRLDVTALGSLYLGAFPASVLAAAGRVAELTPGSLAVADALLTTRPVPLTATGF
jgi:predicted acetyltransferase